jgi:hypothetical protein
VAFGHLSRKNHPPIDRPIERIRQRGFAGLEIPEADFDFLPETARATKIYLRLHRRPGGLGREDRNPTLAKKSMLRLLDHRQQPRKVRDSGRVGVSKFHTASVDMIGGACHGGDVDLV